MAAAKDDWFCLVCKSFSGKEKYCDEHRLTCKQEKCDAKPVAEGRVTNGVMYEANGYCTHHIRECNLRTCSGRTGLNSKYCLAHWDKCKYKECTGRHRPSEDYCVNHAAQCPHCYVRCAFGKTCENHVKYEQCSVCMGMFRSILNHEKSPCSRPDCKYRTCRKYCLVHSAFETRDNAEVVPVPVPTPVERPIIVKKTKLEMYSFVVQCPKCKQVSSLEIEDPQEGEFREFWCANKVCPNSECALDMQIN